MQERSEVERRATTSPVAVFHEDRPGVAWSAAEEGRVKQPIFSAMADVTLKGPLFVFTLF